MASARQQEQQQRDHDVAVKDFKGVNTQASRTAIAENEFAWLENVIPIGYANLRAVPNHGAAVATMPGENVTNFKYVNIANVDYIICSTTAGSAYALNLSTFVKTTIAAGGTFTGTVNYAQWKNERLLIIAGNGYWSWDIVGGLVSLAGVTGAPSAGQTIATYSGRVWIGNNRTITFSAPNSYTDFQTASSGGSFIMTDETLHSNINQLLTANNFLYIVGDASFNMIADVRLGTGSPAPTIFSNINVSAMVGTNLSHSLFPFLRMIFFATHYGFYVLNGATPQKISDALDGIGDLIDFTKPVSGDVAIIFNQPCAAFLFNYKDPAGARPLLSLLFNGKWWFASQGASLTMITGAFQSGVPALFGTDGENIWKLFSDTTSAIATKVVTALWPMAKPTSMKEGLKAGVELTTMAATTTVTLTLDSDFGTVPVTISATNTGNWINAAGVLGLWQNAGLVNGSWISSGFQIFQGDADFKGRYLGYTMTSNSPGFKIEGFLNQHQVSTPWATKAE